MRVTELNDDEMYELKDRLYTDFYYGKDRLPDLTKRQREAIEKAVYPPDIPNWVMYDLYNRASFVKDDFICNA